MPYVPATVLFPDLTRELRDIPAADPVQQGYRTRTAGPRSAHRRAMALRHTPGRAAGVSVNHRAVAKKAGRPNAAASVLTASPPWPGL